MSVISDHVINGCRCVFFWLRLWRKTWLSLTHHVPPAGLKHLCSCSHWYLSLYQRWRSYFCFHGSAFTLTLVAKHSASRVKQLTSIRNSAVGNKCVTQILIIKKKNYQVPCLSSRWCHVENVIRSFSRNYKWHKNTQQNQVIVLKLCYQEKQFTALYLTHFFLKSILQSGPCDVDNPQVVFTDIRAGQ